MSLIQKQIKRSMKMVHKMTMCDVAVFKLAMVVFGLLLAKVFPQLLTLDTWVYVVVFILLTGKLMMKMKWR